MTTLKFSKKSLPSVFKADRSRALPSVRLISKTGDAAEFSRFKVQLKRAVDSIDVPEYLIDAIKTAIRS